MDRGRIVHPLLWTERGELLCDNAERGRVYSFDPVKLLAWLAANKLVKVETTVAKAET